MANSKNDNTLRTYYDIIVSNINSNSLPASTRANILDMAFCSVSDICDNICVLPESDMLVYNYISIYLISMLMNSTERQLGIHLSWNSEKCISLDNKLQTKDTMNYLVSQCHTTTVALSINPHTQYTSFILQPCTDHSGYNVQL